MKRKMDILIFLAIFHERQKRTPLFVIFFFVTASSFISSPLNVSLLPLSMILRKDTILMHHILINFLQINIFIVFTLSFNSVISVVQKEGGQKGKDGTKGLEPHDHVFVEDTVHFGWAF